MTAGSNSRYWRFLLEQSSHHIRIINVGNDDKVNSYVKENLENFKGKGFDLIYGLRDRYTGDKNKRPVEQEAVDHIFEPLANKYNMTLKIIVAVEEIEAWFLSVPNFFSKYHPALTLEHINNVKGVNLSEIVVESISHPSVLIDQILTIVGLRYKKRQANSYRIVNALDYSTLYLEKSALIPALGMFSGAVDNALA